MKYAIIKVINGNYSVHAEGFTDPEKAKASFFGLCQTLWNASDVISADCAIIDENLNVLEGRYKEHIYHEEEVAPVEP
jgi:hypothetical protein